MKYSEIKYLYQSDTTVGAFLRLEIAKRQFGYALKKSIIGRFIYRQIVRP